MTFLEARRILAAFKGGVKRHLMLALSGMGEPLVPFIRARAAAIGIDAKLDIFPFGNLGQALSAHSRPANPEVFLLFPWDFVPEADWRSGIPLRARPDSLIAAAEAMAGRLVAREARGVYVDASIPPLFSDRSAQFELTSNVRSLAMGIGLKILPPSCFSLGSYFATGSAVGGAALDRVAEAIVVAAFPPPVGAAKILVTDLDNVMWAGLVGEDGPAKVDFRPEGPGFRHFVYQSLLARLRDDGVLLAVASRNDIDLAITPLQCEEGPLSVSDFVAMRIGYGAKSAAVQAIVQELGFGLDSVVFVDDNPVEIAEVAAALPQVTCLEFPRHDDSLPAFCERLGELFHRTAITAEDRERTELYRRRFASQPPPDATKADISAFLRGLNMELAIHDRTNSNRSRAIQLINKTNQFNLNGRRLDDDEIDAITDRGGRLLTAGLRDRTGSHGEILACLIDQDVRIVSFVMSCRVFMRRVEHAFVAFLTKNFGDLTFAYAATERNTPLRNFLGEIGATCPAGEGDIRVDAPTFVAAHAEDLSLFKVVSDFR